MDDIQYDSEGNPINASWSDIIYVPTAEELDAVLKGEGSITEQVENFEPKVISSGSVSTTSSNDSVNATKSGNQSSTGTATNSTATTNLRDMGYSSSFDGGEGAVFHNKIDITGNVSSSSINENQSANIVDGHQSHSNFSAQSIVSEPETMQQIQSAVANQMNQNNASSGTIQGMNKQTKMELDRMIQEDKSAGSISVSEQPAINAANLESNDQKLDSSTNQNFNQTVYMRSDGTVDTSTASKTDESKSGSYKIKRWTDTDGNFITDSYDANGNMIERRKVYPDGRTYEIMNEFDGDTIKKQRIKYLDGSSSETLFFDGRARECTLQYSDGKVLKMYFDDPNAKRPTKSILTSATGFQTLVEFDGNKLSRIKPLTPDPFSWFTKKEKSKDESNFFTGFVSSVGTELSALGSTIKNVVYNVSEVSNLNSKLVSLQNSISSAKKTVESSRDGIINNLNPATKEKINVDDLFSDVIALIDNCNVKVSNLLLQINKVEKKAEGINDASGGANSRNYSPTKSSGASYNGNDTVSVVNNTPVEELVIDPQETIINPLINSVIGGISFSEIVALYEEIGGNQVSSSPTANYGLLNIIKKDDKYYYQIIDKETGKVYFTEISDKVKVDSDYKNIVEVKQKAMILSSPETDKQNLVKLAEENSVYLSKEIVENQNLKFANILDMTDSNNYYIPISDSINVIPIDSLGNNEG